MEWEPTASELVVNVAWALPFRLAVPSVVDPSLKVTVPVGVKTPVPVTVAVMTTDWPKTELGTDEVTAVVVVAALTVTEGLVLAVMLGVVMSEAVMVLLPAVFKVTLNVPVPALRAALAGKVALVSLEVMPTVSVTVL